MSSSNRPKPRIFRGRVLSGCKTRPKLIEFGRFAAEKRQRRDAGKPETFNFLGFTHIGARSRDRVRFLVRRKTMSKRLRAKRQEIKQALLKRRHLPIPEQGAWLQAVVRGYLNYHAIPGNGAGLEAFRTQAVRYWLFALRRRSQRSRMTWERFGKLADNCHDPAPSPQRPL